MFKRWFQKKKKEISPEERAKEIIEMFQEPPFTVKEEEEIENELLLGILAYRKKTKSMDGYREEIEELLFPYKDKWE